MFQNLKKNPPTLTLPLKGGRENLVGRVYQADRKTYCRISKSDQRITKRIDTTPETNYNSNMMNYKSKTLKRVQHDRSGSEAHSKHLVPYCLSNLVSSKKVAFTLAEILITLGIIGIVAALTIPTLIANYQKKETVSKLQKAYSTLSNMTMMMHADNAYSALSGTVSAEKTEKFFNEYVLKYFKSPIVSANGVCLYPEAAGDCAAYKYLNNVSFNVSIYTSYVMGRIYLTTFDGISYYFSVMSWVSETDEDGNTVRHAVYTASPKIWVDLNGTKSPNVFGKDVFYLTSDFSTGVVNFECTDRSMDSINQNCSPTSQGTCCAEKIRRDGWQIKDDYPWY